MVSFCTFYSGLSKIKSDKISKEIGKSLDWKLTTDSETELIFTVGFNWVTWGQKITIKYISENAVNITIQTKFSQMGDFGDGQILIKKFVEGYQELSLESEN